VLLSPLVSVSSPASTNAAARVVMYLAGRGAWRGRCPAWSRVRRPPSDGRRSSQNTLKHGKVVKSGGESWASERKLSVSLLLPRFFTATASRQTLCLRPQIRRDNPLNLSILLSGGKETNQD